MHAVEHSIGGRRQHSRAFVTTVVLACLLVAFVTVAAVLASLHNPTIGTADRPPAASTSVASPSVVSRLQAATDAADAATSTLRTQLHQITGIPTLSEVAALVNPYVGSLQHYAAVLQATSVPAAAKTSADTARSLVNQDVEFLGTINGVTSLELGSYLEQFGQISNDVHTALGTFQGDLRSLTG
jgi:hypothetical protein